MDLNIKDTGTITFGDNSTSKVELIDIKTYSSLPSDYVFKYKKEETHRPLTNPALVTLGYEEGLFNLPEMLVNMVFKKD